MKILKLTTFKLFKFMFYVGQVYAGLAGFFFCELGNLSVHLALRNLRPEGSKVDTVHLALRNLRPEGSKVGTVHLALRNLRPEGCKVGTVHLALRNLRPEGSKVGTSAFGPKERDVFFLLKKTITFFVLSF